MANQASGNPFAKVEKLIQALIERLIQESTSEATKKGFCDTELGKATQDRDFRRDEVKTLNVEIAGLEAKQNELEAEIELLTSGLKKVRAALATATDERAKEKADNLNTLKTAKEGLAAVIVAKKILKDFYKQAAKAKVFVQASPVDEDTQGPGFTGAYKGQQEASGGIIGLLEVIQTDFERTIRVTEDAEKTAAAEFILFDRESKSDISGKETKKALDEEDLQTTKSTIAQKMEDMKAAQQLLDTALKTLEDLRPACVDSGMSYAERVAKRDEEITALRKALCILDPQGMEPDCGLVQEVMPPPPDMGMKKPL
jgi:septal ring factor EnvC (AmiA/AmiB activator)